mgnify:CR=1 FL=1
MSKIRYYRWRIRKVISEAQRQAKEFKIIASPERPSWKTDLAYFFDAFIFVLKDGVYVQFAGYGSLSPPQKCNDIEEAIDRVAKWMTEHPSRWHIDWEKI